MKNLFSLFILLLVFSPELFSQAMGSGGRSMSMYEYNLLSRARSTEWNPAEFVGSPFYDQNFKLGKVYLNDKVVADHAMLRYNVFKEYLEFKDLEDNGTIKTIKSDPGMSFDIGNEHFILMINPLTGMLGYYKKIYEGSKYTVYSKPKKIYKEGQKAPTHLTRDILPSYLDRTEYFYQSGETFLPIKPTKSGVQKVFADHKKEIKEFIKEEDLRLKGDEFENDMKRVFVHYESL